MKKQDIWKNKAGKEDLKNLRSAKRQASYKTKANLILKF
jgi:hypothetical protein